MRGAEIAYIFQERASQPVFRAVANLPKGAQFAPGRHCVRDEVISLLNRVLADDRTAD